MSKEIKVKIDKEKCKSCGFCVLYCAKGILFTGKKNNAKGFFYIEFDDKLNKCNSCAICALMCPEAAIEVFKEDKK